VKRKVGLAASVAALLWGYTGSAMAGAAPPDPALTDLVQILHDQGVIDDAQLNQLSAKAAAQEHAKEESWTDRLSLWGDLRGRYEGFYYVGDDSDVPDRSRLRYRLRLNGKAEINDYASVLFTIASGTGDNRSTNQTLGNDPDFAPDAIWIDRAYFRISPFVHGELPGGGGSLWVEFGKVPNPYVWKTGKDFMLWDNDINFEGINLLFENDVAENVNLFANTGYYLLDEMSGAADPYLIAAQAGTHVGIGEAVQVGGRVSYFRFGNLTMDEILRGVDGTDGVTSAGGNIVDGITDGRSIDIVEGALYSTFDCFEDWPITFYGSVSNNFSAVSSDMFPQAGADGLAWGVGGEIGSKKAYVLLGVGWFQIEANATLSQFIDSDLFDGVTNRKGLVAYVSRQIFPNTDFTLSTFWSQPIDDSLPAFADSVPEADRVRLQADVNFKF